MDIDIDTSSQQHLDYYLLEIVRPVWSFNKVVGVCIHLILMAGVCLRVKDDIINGREGGAIENFTVEYSPWVVK